MKRIDFVTTLVASALVAGCGARQQDRSVTLPQEPPRSFEGARRLSKASMRAANHAREADDANEALGYSVMHEDVAYGFPEAADLIEASRSAVETATDAEALVAQLSSAEELGEYRASLTKARAYLGKTMRIFEGCRDELPDHVVEGGECGSFFPGTEAADLAEEAIRRAVVSVAREARRLRHEQLASCIESELAAHGAFNTIAVDVVNCGLGDCHQLQVDYEVMGELDDLRGEINGLSSESSDASELQAVARRLREMESQIAGWEIESAEAGTLARRCVIVATAIESADTADATELAAEWLDGVVAALDSASHSAESEVEMGEDAAEVAAAIVDSPSDALRTLDAVEHWCAEEWLRARELLVAAVERCESVGSD